MTEYDFDRWFQSQTILRENKELARLCWLAGARAENERWVQQLVAKYAAGGKDSINPGLEG